MEHLLAPLVTAVQASVMGIGLIVIVPLLAVPILRWRKEPGARNRLAWLFVLPLPWVILSYWTSFNRHQDGAPYIAPPLAGPLSIAAVAVTLGISTGAIAANKGARRFFTGWSLVNTWFAAIGALICLMATSGDWM